MEAVLYALSLLSGAYEMLVMMIAFHELLTWRLATVWVTLIIANCEFAQLATAFWPQVPLVFFWVVPLTIITTVMSARLLYTKWILTLPIAIFLNAVKRLIGGMAGSFLKWIMSSDAPMRLRQSIDMHNLAANINLFGAAMLCLPAMIIIGLIAHHFVIKSAAADFFQHAKIDHSDYLLVLLCYGLYIGAYAYVMQLSVTSQTFVASASSLIFGIIVFYVVSNKNSRLTDAQLLSEVSDYNELLGHRNQQLHLFKHDYQNILLSLSQYIQNEDMPGLKTYFENEVMTSGQSLNVDVGPEQLRNLQVPALSGLIYSKYEAAASRGVELQLNVLQAIELPEAAHVNIVRILGNLIDNAIDAASQVDHRVQLSIRQTTAGTVDFTVENKVPAGETIDLARIKKSRFTTKPGHLGYGLSSISQLASKNVAVRYQIQEGTFSATLTIHKAH
ncbi:GHKL domain-containing protein [Lactiplantibacillus sp. WILCCON 0030]|uniref:GHKL domain-containing protein n=1 Tax=Lactiplantibacillus brownii TaxID=3069269 RepID=A0ABU1AAY8_9LACO|nr:GHKL domain-containing protein [Lactiplantibacillus brownii]MDQ7938124.1 GHKL domain-containing protein [Lactiplantibacillus brownii]